MRKTAEERRAEILRATFDLADALGPDRLTTGEIAKAVGLTQPAIFRHFPTKQAIWTAAAEDLARRMQAGWDEVLAGAERPADRIEALLRVQLGFIEAAPAIPAILLSRELHAENDQLRRLFMGLMGRFHDRLAAEIERGRAMGQFCRTLAPGDAALLLIGLVQGLCLRWTLSGRSFDLAAEGARLARVQLNLFAARSTTATDRRVPA